MDFKRMSSSLAMLALIISIFVPYVVAGEVGITDTTIKVGSIQPLSGPGQFAGLGVVYGLQAYVANLNDSGGIHGRKIELIIEDDNTAPPRALSAAKKLIMRDKIFCFVANTGTHTVPVIFQLIQKERIPLVAAVSPGINIYDPPKRYVFATTLSYDIIARLIVDYIMKDLKAKDPRIAFIGPDSQMGHDGLKGLKEGTDKYGLKIVATEWFKMTDIDFMSQVLTLKRAKADYVLLWTILGFTAGVLTDAQRFNWNPQFVGPYVALGDNTLEMSKNAAEGLLAVSDQALPYSDVPGVLRHRKFLEKHIKGIKPTAYSVWGHYCAMILEEGLKRAGRNITREGLVDALETLKNFDMQGVRAPITYGPNTRQSSKAGYFVKADVKKTRWVKISDWRDPTPLK